MENWCVSLRTGSFFQVRLKRRLNQYGWLFPHCNVMDLWWRGGFWAKWFSIHKCVTGRVKTFSWKCNLSHLTAQTLDSLSLKNLVVVVFFWHTAPTDAHVALHLFKSRTSPNVIFLPCWHATPHWIIIGFMNRIVPPCLDYIQTFISSSSFGDKP